MKLYFAPKSSIYRRGYACGFAARLNLIISFIGFGFDFCKWLNKSSTLIFAGILCIAAGFSTRNFLERGLWFDEAITVLEFAVWPKSYLGVYLNYSIPNNHILYSVFLRFWLDNFASFFSFANPILRLPSLLIGIAFLLLSFFLWRKYSSERAVFIVLLPFALSPFFSIYSTAIRGYIFSIFVISIAIYAVLASCENRKFAYTAYCACSIIAVGIMPNNFVAIFAVSFMPFIICKIPLNLANLIRYSLVPFISLFVFYLPIFANFLNVISIKEGWESGIAASVVFYLSVFLILSVPIGLAAYSLFLIRRVRKTQILLGVFVFILPVLFFFFRSPSPFPRTFICILPIWLFLFSCLIHQIEKKIEKEENANFARVFFTITILFCLISSISLFLSRKFLSKVSSDYGQDDFFCPYFMQTEFNPDAVVAKLIKITEKKNGIIFAHMSSDYPSLTFSAKRYGMADDFIIHDRPKGKVEQFPSINDNLNVFIVAPDKASAESICKRFALHLISDDDTEFFKQKIFWARK